MRNQITLIGNMGENAQVVNFENGSKVARFSVAINKMEKGVQKTEWHKLFAWGNLAEFIENFGGKGKRIAINGKLVNRTFMSKDGKAQKVTEIEVRQVIGL
jgi:single-strand DNA-binding protein